MKKVLLLWHVYESPGQESDSKLIGVYESQEQVDRARESARKQNGFRDRPDNFIVDEYEVGKDYWPDGFVKATRRKK